VDTGLGHQVGLEFSDIHVQSSVESQGSGQRGDDLSYQPVQVGLGGAFNVQVASTDVLDGLVVQHDGHVGVLQQRVGREHRVVGLHNGG